MIVCLECGGPTRENAAELSSGAFVPVVSCRRCPWYCRTALGPTVSADFAARREDIIVVDLRPQQVAA